MARARKLLACGEKPAPVTSEASTRSSMSSISSTFLEAQSRLGRSVYQRVPLLSWIREMSCKSVRADMIAGLTVGVMVIPQSMSYAGIAGLPYIYGMYAACVPALVYAVFGQSRQLAVGPVAMVSLLINAGLMGQMQSGPCPGWDPHAGSTGQPSAEDEFCRNEYVKLAIFTSAVMGLMQIAAMILRMGFLVTFLGHPVTSGFTSGAAIIIGLSQVKYMLGIHLDKSQYVYVTLIDLAKKIGHTKWMTLLLGVISLNFLLLAKEVSKRKPRFSLLGPLAPLICCAAGTLLLWLCEPLREQFGVSYVGQDGPIPSGIFPLSLDAWDLSNFSKVLPTALSCCLIGYMESIAIGKNLAAKHGYELEAGQELLALGLSNLVGAVFSSYPVTGSFSRSAVNNATGAVSQFAGLITALVMLCTLLFLTRLFTYLPDFVLAAIVISSVAPLVAYKEVIKLWRIKKQDCFLWVAAFLGTLFLGVLQGIALAVGLSLSIVIYESVRPQITILWRLPGTTIYRNVKQESSGSFVPNVFIARIGSSIYFANASFIKDWLQERISSLEHINRTEYIVLEMTAVVSVDSTALNVLEDVVNDFRGRGIQIALAMVGNRLDRTFRKSGLTNSVGEKWFFPSVHDAVVGCLRHQKAKRRHVSTVRGLASVMPSNLAVLGPGGTITDDGTSEASGAGATGGETDLQSATDLEVGLPLSKSQEDLLDIAENPVHMGNEIGFSNDVHHSCTVIFINMVEDVPMIMSDITAIFQRRGLTVCRANIEAMDDDRISGKLGRARGASHVYHIRSLQSQGKLQETELLGLKKDLLELLHYRVHSPRSVGA
ncbi:SULTR4 [Symbiodinium pilosum]|uniref:SULTR4 protein n=1 Tax=Symbiodinium pilosum TaxID=2952 RepID=A0A812WJS7_SYMPI|nr:SULTR4 [Symbiodinium pilosum]